MQRSIQLESPTTAWYAVWRRRIGGDQMAARNSSNAPRTRTTGGDVSGASTAVRSASLRFASRPTRTLRRSSGCRLTFSCCWQQVRARRCFVLAAVHGPSLRAVRYWILPMVCRLSRVPGRLWLDAKECAHGLLPIRHHLAPVGRR